MRDSSLNDGGQCRPSSAIVGGVLLPRLWQVATRSGAASGGIEEWHIDDGGLRSWPREPRSRLGSFLV
jgi:hypothetical protein